MKRWRAYLVFVMLLALSCAIRAESQLSQEQYDFRRTTWGMSKEAVKKAEAVKPERETADQLSYRGNFEGFPCSIRYLFANKALTSAEYVIDTQLQCEVCMIDEKRPEESLYLDDLYKLRDVLKRRYGEPVDRSAIWTNRLYDDDPDRWGVAVRLGHLRLGFGWKTPRTNIRLDMCGIDNEIKLTIGYAQRS